MCGHLYTRWFGSILLAASVAGCATTSPYQTQIEELQARVSDLEAKYLVAASRYDEIERVGQISYAIQDRIDDLGVKQSVHARVIRKLQQEVKSMPYAAAKPVGKAAARTAAKLPAKTAQQQTLSTAYSTDEDYDGDVQEIYGRAYTMLREKRYDESERMFAFVLQKWPKDDLADNALYWMGEIDYDRKKYIEALKKFETVEQKYPAGNKVPDALLKQAFAWRKLGDSLKFEQVAARLIENYPWSPAAEKAEEARTSGGTD